MNYQLNKGQKTDQKEPILTSIKRLGPLLAGEKKSLYLTLATVLISSGSILIAPIIIGHTIDTYLPAKDYNGILFNAAILFAIYIAGSIASYVQTKAMGGVGRRMLFNLRNAVFTRLQELPVDFFSQNKTGDLISRINSDTDKINQFFSQALMQFLGNFFLIVGAGIFIVFLSPKLGLATLLPALGVLIITQIISPWVKRSNLRSLQSTGSMSSEIQENLNNFKVIIAFNRLDYFRKKFEEVNTANYSSALRAGIANNIFTPLYGLASNLAQLIALAYGIYLVNTGYITVGLLIGFQFYVNNFYSPLKQLASVWSSFQLALASLDRISEVLALKSNMQTVEHAVTPTKDAILEFQNVTFAYNPEKTILKDINLILERWKTYALVWPTGGGKTTTALLMARLYDPTSWTIILDQKDIRSYEPSQRTDKIGFILQEPFLFTGTLANNILYGNAKYAHITHSQILELLTQKGLTGLLSKFENGLDTPISTSGESISLGQKQLLAFMRAILKEPEILILDEATANIDTVTEQLLEEMLSKLPKSTTKVIIAHRLNTIKDADEIFFVNAAEVVNTGNMEHALDMLLHWKRAS